MNYTELTAAIEQYTENTFTSDEMATFVKQAEQRIYNVVQLANLRKNTTGTITSGNKYLSAPADYLSSYSLAVYSYATTTGTKVTNLTMTVSSATGIVAGQYVYGTNITDGTTVVSVVGTTVTVSASLASFTSGSLTFQGDYEYLQNKDVNFIRQVYPNPLYTAIPKYYAIFGPTTGATTDLSFILGPTPDIGYKAELHYYYYPESIVDAGTSWLGDNFDSALFYGSLVEAYIYMKGEPDMMAAYDNKFKEALALLKNLGDGKQRGDAYRDGQVKVKVQ